MPKLARCAAVLVAASLIATVVPAHVAPARQAYTADRRFLVKLLSLPDPIPFEQYFALRLEVYDGRNPAQPLADARIQVLAGMAHGLGQGFAHGMQSSPQVATRAGVALVSGMYFHMTGAWTMEVTVHRGAEEGVASFQLPCCGQ
jgi:hypothetical protein